MPKKFARKVSGDKVDLIRKHFEEEGKKTVGDRSLGKGENTHTVAVITHYGMRGEKTVPFPFLFSTVIAP